MVLLLQLNGDLPETFPGHERRLYVFTCRRKTCRRKEGSVRALRAIRTSEISSTGREDKGKTAPPQRQELPAKPATNIGDTLFGAKSSSTASSFTNPFSTSASNSGLSNTFSASSAGSDKKAEASSKSKDSISPQDSDLPKTFASVVSINNDAPKFGPASPPEPWPQESEQPPAYPLYYLAEADYEILDKVEEPPVPTQTMDYDEGSGSSSQKEDKDVYESTIDKTFQKFADRLSQNPEQVIRYEFRGQPLLYSKHDAVGKLLAAGEKQHHKVTTTSGTGNKMPRCGNCGAGRVFEVQLTPHAIMELESEEMGLDGMEWGTIIVGVCDRDCQQRSVAPGGVGYVEEWAGVQWEELSVRK